MQLIHGDAKAANFCYSADFRSVAAVDFQYVGKGVGVVDLAYFLGSCLNGEELETKGQALLDHYFNSLSTAIAWADFERFLQGWSPGHPKLNSYSAKQTLMALKLV